MSILTQLLRGQITFKQAAMQAEQWAAAIIAKDPTLSSAAAVLVSDVKQGASNAVDLAESSLLALIGPVTGGLEQALEAALAKATNGVSLPFNPLITHGIETIANAVRAEVTAWELKTKASLGQPAPTMQPIPNPAPPPAAQ